MNAYEIGLGAVNWNNVFSNITNAANATTAVATTAYTIKNKGAMETPYQQMQQFAPPPPPPKKDNTLLFVGVGGLILIGGLAIYLSKK